MDIKLKNIIEKNNSIIIHRHKRPDMDAIGSQMGLFHLLKENYPNKEIYVVGDSNKFLYNSKMDEIEDEIFNQSLSIILDTSVDYMISDERYKIAKEVIVIDHHRNDINLETYDLFYQLSEYTSACEILVHLAKTYNWKVSDEAATYIYAGMVTDTGRFRYINNENASRVFENASFITKFKPNINDMYNFLYTESLEERQTKNLFQEFNTTENMVAYRKNNKELILKSGLDIFGVSRGMVNQMAGIKEIPIWVSFTEDFENDKILAEVRSRDITVVDICKEFGGGGHNNACGASLKDFDEADLMLEKLDERAKEYGNIK